MMEERAILAGGCFWGMQDLIRRQPGVWHPGRLPGGEVPNATYHNHGNPRRGGRDRLRPDEDQLPGPAGVLLPDP